MNIRNRNRFLFFVLVNVWVWGLWGEVAWVNAEPENLNNSEQQIMDSSKDRSLLDLYWQGGWMMHVIAICSMATIAVGVYCGIQINKRRMLPKETVTSLNFLMANRDVEGAFQICRQVSTPLTNALFSALIKVNFERDMYNKAAMEEAASETVVHEETRYMLWVNYLNVFATIAPMIGLLGTVTGMIEAFNQLAAGRSEPDGLAGGIGQAMVTTAGGLMVGIPAMFCFFFFRNLLQGAIADVQVSLSRMFDLFTGELTMNGAAEQEE